MAFQTNKVNGSIMINEYRALNWTEKTKRRIIGFLWKTKLYIYSESVAIGGLELHSQIVSCLQAQGENNIASGQMLMPFNWIFN